MCLRSSDLWHSLADDDAQPTIEEQCVSGHPNSYREEQARANGAHARRRNSHRYRVADSHINSVIGRAEEATELSTEETRIAPHVGSELQEESLPHSPVQVAVQGPLALAGIVSPQVSASLLENPAGSPTDVEHDYWHTVGTWQKTVALETKQTSRRGISSLSTQSTPKRRNMPSAAPKMFVTRSGSVGLGG